MINLINVEEPLRNALEIIGRYCKHNDCKTCGLKINDDTCITDKDPDIWWMYLTEPQTITMVKDHGRKQALEMINLYHELKTEPQTYYKKWETPPKFEHKGINTNGVVIPACLLEIEDEQRKESDIDENFSR